MSFPSDRPAIWFVTGTSRGLGLELVTQLLQRGDHVAATTRSTGRLLSALGDRADTSRLLPLTVDLRDDEAVRQGVRQTVERFGSLDVVVNNAGYGFLAAVEETGQGPLRQLLGSDAHSFAAAKVNALRANLEATAQTAPTTDFPTA